jgi:hypothetical protein
VQRVPEITVYRQKAGCVDVREKIASVPYHRPSRPTWVHQASLSLGRGIWARDLGEGFGGAFDSMLDGLG